MKEKRTVSELILNKRAELTLAADGSGIMKEVKA